MARFYSGVRALEFNLLLKIIKTMENTYNVFLYTGHFTCHGAK